MADSVSALVGVDIEQRATMSAEGEIIGPSGFLAHPWGGRAKYEDGTWVRTCHVSLEEHMRWE